MSRCRNIASVTSSSSYETARQALDYLYCRGEYDGRRDGHPALVLLDLKMPKVDGIEVLRQVKSDPALKHIPVVVLTSSREEQDLVRTYSLGVNAYVVKPVAFDEFIDAVTQLGGFWAVVNEASSRELSKLYACRAHARGRRSLVAPEQLTCSRQQGLGGKWLLEQLEARLEKPVRRSQSVGIP